MQLPERRVYCTCMYDSIHTGVGKRLHTLPSHQILDEPPGFPFSRGTLANTCQRVYLSLLKGNCTDILHFVSPYPNKNRAFFVHLLCSHELSRLQSTTHPSPSTHTYARATIAKTTTKNGPPRLAGAAQRTHQRDSSAYLARVSSSATDPRQTGG